MLSRVADALYWMSRYLERAEHIARLLDVCFHLELDLRGVTAAPYELHWTSLTAILQQIVPPTRDASFSPQGFLTHWLTFDAENPASIMNCVARSRHNARGVRGTINSAMWKQLNKLYWKLSDSTFACQARESPHDFYEAVEAGSFTFQGVCDATLTHDESWQFIQLGKYLERADKTLRILDIQYHLLQDMNDPANLSVSNLYWAGVLRSCRAYESYQHLFVGRVEPERVVDLLLLNPSFPRSVSFALESACTALAAIEDKKPSKRRSRASRLMGKVLADLQYSELHQILSGDLHGFLSHVLVRCQHVGRVIQEHYSLQ